jgi:hypothetical protein
MKKRNSSWKRTEKTTPMAMCPFNVTTISHNSDDVNKEQSQKKALNKCVSKKTIILFK